MASAYDTPAAKAYKCGVRTPLGKGTS